MNTVFKDGLFDGKVALVTGGGSGIGFRTALELAVLGCTVIIAARKLDRLMEAADMINNYVLKIKNQSKGTVFPIAMDIRSTESRSECINQTLEKFKKIDYLVSIFWKK